MSQGADRTPYTRPQQGRPAPRAPQPRQQSPPAYPYAQQPRQQPQRQPRGYQQSQPAQQPSLPPQPRYTQQSPGQAAYAQPQSPAPPAGQQYYPPPQGYQPQRPYGPPGQNSAYWGPRPTTRQAPVFSEEALRLHEESAQLFPELNLSKGEFVLKVIRRHPIGLLGIWAGAGAVIVISIAVIIFILISGALAGLTAILGVVAVALVVSAITAGGALIATYVYKRNLLYVTNESLIQRLQRGIFTHREQTISLRKVEDISYHKSGILDHLIGYGNIRMSTVGAEQSYQFTYVKNPGKVVAMLNDAVEAYSRSWPMVDMVDKASLQKEGSKRRTKRSHKTDA